MDCVTPNTNPEADCLEISTLMSELDFGALVQVRRQSIQFHNFLFKEKFSYLLQDGLLPSVNTPKWWHGTILVNLWFQCSVVPCTVVVWILRPMPCLGRKHFVVVSEACLGSYK